MFARNQSQIAGHLLAALEAPNVTDGEREGQRGDRTHAWLCHPQPRLLVPFGRLLRHLVQLADLAVQTFQQSQQVLAPPRRPTFQRKLAQCLLPGLRPQLVLLLHPPVQHQVLQSVLYPRTDLHQFVPNQQLPQIALLRRGRPQPRKPSLHQ